jgi:hypothetical protein
MSEIRMLDDLGAELARVAQSPPPRRARLASGHAVTLAIALIVLLGAGVYAVPATRATIDDITSSLASWVEGDEDAAPGRAVRPEDDTPDWIRTDDTRLIAKVRDLPLYVSHTENHQGIDGLEFMAGNAFGIWDSVEGWRSRFDNHAVVVLGPSPVSSRMNCDEFALFGVTAGSVASMALTYASGEPTRADGLDGGFAVIADAHRPLDEVIVYDEAGRELERTDASYITGLGSKCIELNRKRAEGG